MSKCLRVRKLCAVIIVGSMMFSMVAALPAADSEAAPTDDAITSISSNPGLYWIGFNDTALNPMNDVSVNAASDYLFTFQYNYSLGWFNCEFLIRAWLDNGALGTASAYPAAPGDGERNLAFEILCDSNGITTVNFPAMPDLEITSGPANIMLWQMHPDPAQDHYRVQIPVWFGNQLRMADYGGMAPMAPPYHEDQTIALNNADSWDFSITVRDVLSPSMANTSYGEFGINPHASISAVGNPTVESPPGTAGSMMVPTSQITYSANIEYWVNISVTDLYPYGNPMYPYWIPASDIMVQNTHSDATSINSEISVPYYFPGSGIPLNVWGQPAAPANNGLVSAGPLMTDFTNMGVALTELQFWADIPAGTVESCYWGTVTLTIEAGGITVVDQSTILYVNAVFPKLYWIGFNESSGDSRLDQTVNTDSWYDFTLQANYSMGWDNCEVIIEAWYDEGMFGGMSQYPIENQANENRAFRISYTPYNGACQVLYPTGPQVQVGTVSDTELWDYGIYPLQLHHRVEIPVWLGSSLVAADGSGFISGDPPYHADPWMALGDANSWDFRVSIGDMVYPTSMNGSHGEFGLDNTTSSFNVQLQTGWNLISLPLDLNSNSVPEVLTSISGKWSVVKYFDAQDDADPWKTYRAGSIANDLAFIDHRVGLWIFATENCTLTAYGRLLNSTDIPLKAGWNMVGYPSATPRLGSETLPGFADRVSVWQASAPYIADSAPGAVTMSQGNGYWVHVTSDCTWTVDW